MDEIIIFKTIFIHVKIETNLLLFRLFFLPPFFFNYIHDIIRYLAVDSIGTYIHISMSKELCGTHILMSRIGDVAYCYALLLHFID